MTNVVVFQTAFLGDVVLTTPLLREIRRVEPKAAITVVTTPVGAQLLRQLPFVDDLVAYDKRGGERGPAALIRLGLRLRAASFEAAVAAHRSHRTALLVRLCASPSRIGFDGSPGSWACNRRVAWKPGDHAIHRYLALAEGLGADPSSADPRPVLAVGDTARDRVESLLRDAGIGPANDVLAVAPGSVWATKRWTPEGFAEVVRGASARGLRPVLVGSPAERELCLEVARLSKADAPVLAGSTPIPELVGLMARSRALVTNDSGPGHVATAVGTPVVAVFGPTHPRLGYAPFGEAARVVQHPDLSCRPCHHHGPRRCPLGHFRCMREVGADAVLSALDELLARS